MDRGKGIDTGRNFEFRSVKARNVNSKNLFSENKNTAPDNSVAKGASPLADAYESVENTVHDLPKFDQQANGIVYDACVHSIVESNRPLISFNAPSITQNVLKSAPVLTQTYSAAALSSNSLQEEQVFQRLFNNTFSGEYLECNGAIVMCNHRFGELLRIANNLLVGKSATHLLGLDPASLGFIRNNHSRYRDCERSEFVVKVKVGPGEVRWLNCSITRYFRDRIRLAFGSVIDISEQVQNSRSLKAANEKIQALSLQLVGSRELERKRVALELHDGISQSLSAIKLNIEHYVAVMSKPDKDRSDLDDETSNLGNRLVGYIQNTIEEIRRIAVDLSPSILEDLGLVQTIRWFCREFENVHQRIKVKKYLSINDENIPEPLKIVIYRILQESLNNASKHSNATEVYVEIAVLPKGIRLCVRDNGNGIKAKNKERINPLKGGMGLRSMRERVQSTGGLFKIRSLSGKGVSVHVLWSRSRIEVLRRQAVINHVSGECGYAV